MSRVVHRRLGTTLVVAGLMLATTGGPIPADSVSSASASAAPRARTEGVPRAVIGRRVIGHSVRGRRIVAWHLGERGRPKVLLVATMHGNEGAPRQILQALRDGPPIHDLDLWVVPAYNPDGLAAGTRTNARGVDLNRNYPYHWVDLDGSYESGASPASEPETVAMMRFLRRTRPSRIISFHQPLHGVDTDTKVPAFSRSVARALDLPLKSFTCGGVCHGTMTGWFNARFAGAALTAEYGDHPTRHQLRVEAPRRLLSIWGASRG